MDAIIRTDKYTILSLLNLNMEVLLLNNIDGLTLTALNKAGTENKYAISIPYQIAKNEAGK